MDAHDICGEQMERKDQQRQNECGKRLVKNTFILYIVIYEKTRISLKKD